MVLTMPPFTSKRRILLYKVMGSKMFNVLRKFHENSIYTRRGRKWLLHDFLVNDISFKMYNIQLFKKSVTQQGGMDPFAISYNGVFLILAPSLTPPPSLVKSNPLEHQACYVTAKNGNTFKRVRLVQPNHQFKIISHFRLHHCYIFSYQKFHKL